MIPTRNYSGIDSAITQRPVSSAILGIDSEDRVTDLDGLRETYDTFGLTNSPYSFTINKNASILNGFFTRIGITEIVFPWVIPNINDRTNEIAIRYDVGAGDVDDTIVLPNGFYTPAQLAAAIQLQVRALDPALNAFTAVYGIGIPFGGITSSVPAFSFATNNPAATFVFIPLIANTDDYPYPPQTRQLYDLLGLTNYTPGVAPPPVPPVYGLDDTLNGGYTLCQAIRYVDIVCTQLTNNQSLKDNSSSTTNRDLLARLYIADPSSSSAVDCRSATFCPTGCMPFVMYKEYAQPKFIQWLPNQPVPGSLKFEVYSDDGTLLSAYDENTISGFNRTDWSMTLLASEN